MSTHSPPDWLAARLLPERLAAVAGSPHWAAELGLLDDDRVARYYRHVLESVELSADNPRNSYLMWACGKVEALDTTRGPDVVPGRYALPDIDSDFPVEKRERIIDYVRSRYGAARVAQMATFSRMQGRGALKDVLRAHERCGAEEMNRITEHVPDEAAIADDLQEMAGAGEEPSIIRWALEHNAEALRQWCYVNEQGELDGPLALDFAQAIRLEGTRRSQSKHASGVVICSEDLAGVAPMMWDRNSGQMLVHLDMRDAESCGLVKFDILGTTVLDKMESAESFVRTGLMG